MTLDFYGVKITDGTISLDIKHFIIFQVFVVKFSALKLFFDFELCLSLLRLLFWLYVW